MNQNQIVKYEVNGQEIKLSPDIIRNYLVSGDGRVTDQEVMMFLSLCKYQKLNPFLREAYLVKYGNQAATIVTGKETYTKRAAASPLCDGYKAGIYVVTKDGEIQKRAGSMFVKALGETVVGGWAEVYRKDWKVPVCTEVSFDEYVGRKRDGTITKMWSEKGATMIRKVALVQALREALPEELGGTYSPEEINTVQVENLPITKVDDPGLSKMLSEVGRKHHPDYMTDEYLDEAAKIEEAEFEEETELISADQVKKLHEKYLHHAQIVGAILNDHDIKGAKNIPAFMLDGIIEEIEEAIELNEEAEAEQKRIGEEG